MTVTQQVEGMTMVQVDIPNHGDFWMHESDFNSHSGAVMRNADDWVTFEPSYAHMFNDGVSRHGKLLCEVKDVTAKEAS